MTILSNLGNPVVELTAAADILAVVTTARISIGAMNVKNNTAGDVEIDFYISTDATSANGQIVATHSLSAGASTDVFNIIGQGYPISKFIVAVSATSNLWLSTTYTEYTNDDA